jgi:hypothetical protein
VAINDVYQVTIVGSLDGQRIENVLHYYCTAEGAGNGASALATNLDVSLGLSLRAFACVQYQYLYMQAQKIWPLPVLVPAVADTNAGGGAITGAALPTECAVTITKQSAYAGRGGRGRIYVAGIAESDVAASQLLNAARLRLQTFADFLPTTAGVAGWQFTPVIYHRITHLYTQIIQARANVIIRSQRRRQLGKGV